MILGHLKAALYDNLPLWAKLSLKDIAFRVRRDSRHELSTPTLLVFDERIPTPDRDAGSLRMMRILSILRAKYYVIFLPFTANPDLVPVLTDIGVKVADVGEYRRLLKSGRVIATVVSRPSMAALFTPRIRRLAPRTRVIFDTVDVHFIRLDREFALCGDAAIGAEAKRYREIETELARAVDVIWCASVEDDRLLHEAVGKRESVVIPTLHELHEPGPGFDERRGLLFVGSFAHRPNADAVEYFLKEILPDIRRVMPEIAFTVVGADPPDNILALASDSVRIAGFIPELEPTLASVRVMVAPLRYGGAGTKGKVGEALSRGIPVVTTAIGAEGFGLTSGKDALIADDPTEFARAVVRAYSDKSLWQRLSENGRARIAADFTPAAVANKVLASVDPASETQE